MYKFFKYLAGLRLMRGLSEEEMASILDVSIQRMRLIEQGQGHVPPETLIAYANALHMNVDELALHLINEMAQDFCRKAGLTKKLQFSFREDDPCGLLLGAEARSKYVTNRQTTLSPRSARQKITD